MAARALRGLYYVMGWCALTRAPCPALRHCDRYPSVLVITRGLGARSMDAVAATTCRCRRVRQWARARANDSLDPAELLDGRALAQPRPRKRRWAGRRPVLTVRHTP